MRISYKPTQIEKEQNTNQKQTRYLSKRCMKYESFTNETLIKNKILIKNEQNTNRLQIEYKLITDKILLNYAQNTNRSQTKH